jgi:nucleoside-diphosphate-sugar epimerase
MILVTGSSGFVGQSLIKRLTTEFEPSSIIAVVRNQSLDLDVRVPCIEIGDLSNEINLSQILQRVDIVVHCAGRAHVMNDRSPDALAEFRRVNVQGTVNLARQAAAAGVKRFIFLSSIKVNGGLTEMGKPFTADDESAPEDPYGISKYEAEQALRQIASDSGMEFVVIRPPLVYGPGVKANFESMMKWLAKGIPLPLGAITGNRRSLVALDNLIDLILTCLSHPNAANQIFLVSDGEDISTTLLLSSMGKALGRPARLFYMPLVLLKVGALLMRKKSVYQRLTGSLQLDITNTQKLLDWTPPVTLDEGLRRVAKGFNQ